MPCDTGSVQKSGGSTAARGKYPMGPTVDTWGAERHSNTVEVRPAANTGRRNDVKTRGTRGETDEDVVFCWAPRCRVGGGRTGAGCRRGRAVVQQVPPLPRCGAGRQE